MQKNQGKIENTKSPFGLLGNGNRKLFFIIPISLLDFYVNIFTSMRVVNPLFHKTSGKFFRVVFQFFRNQFFCIKPKKNWEIKSVNQNISDFMFKFSHALFIPHRFVNGKIIPLKNLKQFRGLNRNGFCDIRRSQLIPTTFLQKFSNFRNGLIHILKEKTLSNRPEIFRAKRGSETGKRGNSSPTPPPSLACLPSYIFCSK